ncbi:MAG: sigma-70 family RNA polymerase sigma factor [Polyangiaceae bacterium]|nr:sigma-70 family RNA polymerase sigma factor [Polyangiaceae bacterium]
MVSRPQRAAQTPVDDTALIERARTGEEQAFTALYQAHVRYVAGVVYRMLGSDAELDDIVQETFVEALRQLDALRDTKKLRPFLVTIAVRRIHARLSLRYRMRSLATRLFGTAPQVSNPEDAAPIHSLYETLSEFPARHRIVWVLHRVEGYTLPEVSEQSSASLATVKRWIAEIDRKVQARDASD